MSTRFLIERSILANLTPEEFVKFSLKIGALELLPEGRELKSGRLSPYFFNSGLYNSGEAIEYLALTYAMKIAEMDVEPDYIFGPAYKGIPLCATIALQYYRLTGKNIKFIFDRKEEKDHGEKGIIIGFPEGQTTFQGGRVVIVDDVMTSGESCVKADEMIRIIDGIPVACVIGFDRQEKGKDSEMSAVQMFTEKTGVLVESASNLKQLTIALRDNYSPESIEGKVFQRIITYNNLYGVDNI